MSAPTLSVAMRLDERTLDVIADLVAERLVDRLPTDAGEDRWMPTAEAASYLGMSVHALHRLTAAREIPFSQDGPNAKCYFLRSELARWRKEQR